MDRLAGLRMSARIVLVYVLVPVFGGCTSNEPGLQIMYDHGSSGSYAPPVRREVERGPTPTVSNYPRGWVPPVAIEKKWKAIVIHHSATETGNAAMFDKEHEERGWEGVGYDFVIGNGTDSRDGQVEVTFRWRQQKTGAHCKTPNNWANEEAVGICLVGDFSKRQPTRRQMRSLEELVEFLQKRYGIRKSRVYGHKHTPGARPTDCPGRYFPMGRLKSALAF
jgi:N-acetyl-anhydromuramyl-L-alanine amidase AmpD